MHVTSTTYRFSPQMLISYCIAQKLILNFRGCGGLFRKLPEICTQGTKLGELAVKMKNRKSRNKIQFLDS